MNLLKIITTFLVIYLIFRIVTMYVFPALIRWYLKRFQRKFYEQNPHLRNQEQSKGSGSRNRIIVNEEPVKDGKNPSNEIGEYVDYEEIKEDKKKKEE
jgi:hypothetical protein